MHDEPTRRPETLDRIEAETRRLGFDMASGERTGAALALLGASKPEARCLELGTGTGLATAWLLDGLDADSSVLSIDSDPEVQQVAREALGADERLELACGDAAQWIGRLEPGSFDLIFADAWPGKFDLLEETLALLRPGGIYVIDDLLPQPNWPDGHAPKVPLLIDRIEAVEGLRTLRLAWCTGLLLAVRTADDVRDAASSITSENG